MEKLVIQGKLPGMNEIIKADRANINHRRRKGTWEFQSYGPNKKCNT